MIKNLLFAAPRTTQEVREEDEVWIPQAPAKDRVPEEIPVAQSPKAADSPNAEASRNDITPADLLVHFTRELQKMREENAAKDAKRDAKEAERDVVMAAVMGELQAMSRYAVGMRKRELAASFKYVNK